MIYQHPSMEDVPARWERTSIVCSADIATDAGTSPSKSPGKELTQCTTRKSLIEWWARRDSNPQPRDYESPALTIELQALQ